MKILITGANGMLANSVRTKLSNYELILTDVSDLDITNKEAVIKFVELYKVTKGYKFQKYQKP